MLWGDFMAFVRIISGSYGLKTGGIVRAKTRRDPPFELNDREAERLISLGVAEITYSTLKMPVRAEKSVNNKISTTAPEIPPVAPVSAAIEGAEDIPEDGEDDIPEYGESTPISELKNIAKEYGVPLKSGASKDQIIKALDDYFSESAPDLPTGEVIE